MRLYAIIIICLFSILKSTISLGQKTAAGWVYAYSFDGNAYDVGPNRMHGQIEGGVSSSSDRFGRADKSLKFNGENGFIRIPFGIDKNLPTTNFAFTIWLCVDHYNNAPEWDAVNSNNYSPIFCKTETESTFQFRFGASDKGFYFDGGEEGTSKGLYTKNGIALAPGKWNMIAISFNGYVAKYFLNGKLIACENVAVNFIQNKQPLIVGCDFPGQASYFAGMMDDFTIWERFISEDEIKQIFAVQSKYPFLPPPITIPVVAVVNKPNLEIVPKKIDTIPAKKLVDNTSTRIILKEDTAIKFKKEESSVFEVKKGNKFVLKHVLFVQSKDEFLPGSYAELDRLVTTLLQNPNVYIEVSGHSDNQGNRDLNLKLSEDRAIKVKDYLVSRGIDAKRISVKGYGPDRPISPNDTEENRRLNRRVEFEIVQM